MSLNLPGILLIIILFCNCFIAVYVISRDIYNKLYQSFFLLSIIFIFWNFQAISMRIFNDHDKVLFLVKFFGTGIVFIPTAFFYFYISIINKAAQSKFKIILKISLGFSILFAVLTWINDLIVKDVILLQDGSFFPLLGNKILNILLALHYLILPVYSIYLLYHEYLHCINVIEKRKYYTVIMGAFILVLGGLTDIIFVNFYKGIYPIGHFTIFIYDLLLAIAILKYHLMDIEIFIKRTFVYSIVFNLVTVSFLAVVLIIDFYLKKYTGISSFFITALTVALLTLISQPLRDKIFFLVDHYFFKEKYEQQETLNDFTSTLTSELNRDQVLELIMQTINRVLHVNKMSILLKNSNNSDEFQTIATYGKKDHDNQYSFNSSSSILQFLSNNKNKSNIIIRHLIEKDSKTSSLNNQILNELKYIDSYVLLPITIKNKLIGFINLGEKLSGDIYHRYDIKLLNTISNESAIAIENSMLYTELRKSFINTVYTLSTAIEAKDAYTRGHSDRVSNYAINIASYMKLKDNTIENIKIGGMLHDIGKIGVPDEILLKKGRLTPMEFAEIIKHPTIGASILAPAKFPEEIMHIIKHHHERVDGTGYPDHLGGLDIPLTARIVTVADVFEAITSDRAYRKALDINEGIHILHEGCGHLFDTTIVEIFLDILEEKKRREEE